MTTADWRTETELSRDSQRIAAKTLAPARKSGTYRYSGRLYPSVTSILKVLNKPALIPWAARTAAALALTDPDTYSDPDQAGNWIYEKTDAAKDRGTAVHAYLSGESITLPLALQGYARAADKFHALYQPKPILSEQPIYNATHGYAGTPDLVATLADGQTWILEFKSREAGKPAVIYDENKLQAVAYQAAEFWLDGKDRHPMPPVDACGVVLLGEDGLCSLIETQAPLDVFLALLTVHRWQKGNGR